MAANHWPKPNLAAAAWVSPDAVLIGDVRLGEGVSIWPMAVLRADLCSIEVGSNSNIQDGAVIHGAGGYLQLPILIVRGVFFC